MSESSAASRGWTLAALTMAALFAGCHRGSQKQAEPPAKVAKIANEEQLNTIQLTAAAEERLGIELAAVEQRPMQRVRTYGGEVTLPPGASIVVSAPLAGELQAPTNSEVPKVGAVVSGDQPIFLLLPLLSPERAVLTPSERVSLAQAKSTLAQTQIDAEAQVQQAKIQVEAAAVALARAERLLNQQAGTARAVEDAKALHDLAQKTLHAAETRLQLVDSIKLDEEQPGKLHPLPLVAPQAGIVRALQVKAGEVVAAGAPLFEIMDGGTVWIKAPIYVGELDEIEEQADALVSSPSAATSADALTATPTSAPPTALSLASTVDLYYKLDNREGLLRPGQRVSVQVKLKGRESDLVIPWSAVIHDIQGGTWVYERTSPQTYVRRRVQVRHVMDRLAVLKEGPAAGAEIVTAGAMELFGTEFGFAK